MALRTAPRLLPLCLMLLVALGCARTEQAAPTLTPPTATAPGTTFQNPVLRNDFPDPHIIRVGESYYAYATNGSGKNVQLSTSTDLVHWSVPREAMPALPTWAKGGFTWAPEVLAVGDRYLLYFTARDAASGRQCIGVAVSDAPEGKFRDRSEAPLVCQVAEGGSIDASPFRDADGSLYLYWKNDGNCCSQPTWLYVQPLSPDGLRLTGEPTRLVRNDRAWEGAVVEAPTMWRHADRYYLFFSANAYAGADYAVGYATCASAVGPCEDAPENPILTSVREQPLVIGPGHQTIVQDAAGTDWLVYHAWEISSAGTRTDRRFVWLDPLVWQDGRPVVRGPTTAPQPVPVID